MHTPGEGGTAGAAHQDAVVWAVRLGPVRVVVTPLASRSLHVLRDSDGDVLAASGRGQDAEVGSNRSLGEDNEDSAAGAVADTGDGADGELYFH